MEQVAIPSQKKNTMSRSWRKVYLIPGKDPEDPIHQYACSNHTNEQMLKRY
jgi:hypothetical protein